MIVVGWLRGGADTPLCCAIYTNGDIKQFGTTMEPHFLSHFSAILSHYWAIWGPFLSSEINRVNKLMKKWKLSSRLHASTIFEVPRVPNMGEKLMKFESKIHAKSGVRKLQAKNAKNRLPVPVHGQSMGSPWASVGSPWELVGGMAGPGGGGGGKPPEEFGGIG